MKTDNKWKKRALVWDEGGKGQKKFDEVCKYCSESNNCSSPCPTATFIRQDEVNIKWVPFSRYKGGRPKIEEGEFHLTPTQGLIFSAIAASGMDIKEIEGLLGIDHQALRKHRQRMKELIPHIDDLNFDPKKKEILKKVASIKSLKDIANELSLTKEEIEKEIQEIREIAQKPTETEKFKEIVQFTKKN